MNLFQNILQSAWDKFLGKAQPMSLETSLKMPQPQAPKTNAYVAPQTSSFIPQAKAWQSLVSDDEIKQMIDAWASDKEIEILVNELEKERGGQQQVQPTAQAPEKSLFQKWSDFLSNAWDTMMNITGGAVEQWSRVLWNIAWEWANLWAYTPMSMASAAIRAPFVKETYWQLREQQKQAWEPMKKLGEQWAQFIKKTWPYNPDSTWASVGRLWTNILSTIVWPWKVFKTAEKANVAIRTLAWLANASIEWATSAVTNYVATEWRLPTAKEVAEFIAVTWGLKAIWNVAWQVKKLPSARLIPTTITEAGRDLRKWLDIGEAISKTWISFTKWQLIKKVEKISSNLSWKVDSAIKKAIDTTWPNNVTISSLTKWLKSEILNDSAIKAQLKGTPIQMKQIEDTIDETMDAYKKLYGAKKFDLNAQQQLKKDIYTWLDNVFNKNLQTGKITAQQATERQIARKLKENIETQVPEVAILNKQLAPYLEAWKRLNAKGGYSGYLTDILAGGFASWSPTGIINDPVWYAKNFLLWVVAKRAWTSTLAKTSASTITANIEKLFKNPTFQKAILDQYRQSNQ